MTAAAPAVLPTALVTAAAAAADPPTVVSTVPATAAKAGAARPPADHKTHLIYARNQNWR